ncbi:MAG: ketol-acid reductoisomerase [Candidatus Omnitrophica bacterium]|nr:ketol-acid reductoisomerase [Candidatus Omnitrophota bacterium]
MTKIYYDDDADLSVLKGKTIAVVGYGIQGRGQALNLRDSGLKVVVAQRLGPHYDSAVKDGFKPVTAAEAARASDLTQILTQDHLQAQIYKSDIAPHLKKGKALVFSHGFNIHFKQIVPPKDVDVFMIAPKAPGSRVRELFQEGKGTPCLVAIHQDFTGKALDTALAYAKGIGGTRAGVLETTFKEETETDLFGEQTVLCGGVSELIRAGFETLVDAGYQPELAYFECLHELKLITDLIYATGIKGMRRRVSNTAAYGDMTRGRRIVDQHTREEMQRILKEIQSGEFAREWIKENEEGRPHFDQILKKDDSHLIEQVGERLRQAMPFMVQK